MGVSIIIILIVLSFYLYITRENLSRKFKRIIKNPEVTYILETFSNMEKPPEKFEIDEILNMETVKVKSEYTKEIMEYDEFLPKGFEKNKIKRVLILLHGIRDCKEDWYKRGKLIENYHYLLKKKQIEEMVLIVPNSGYSGESWYSNFYHESNFRYEEFFSKELFEKLKDEYPEAKFGIVGFSMGGYGAFRLGLHNLDKFQVIGSISGAISLVRMIMNKRVFNIFRYVYVPKFVFKSFDQQHFVRVFGSQGRAILKQDPYTILKTTPKKNHEKVKFYASVGSEDKAPYLMLQQWLDSVGRLKKHNYDFKAYIYKDGKHTWEYVSVDLKNFLRYFYKNTK
ncbi:MAG: alpha/beta hydrolase [Fusobacteriaceae bacterium]